MQLFGYINKCSVWSFQFQEGLNALHIACNTGNLEICRLVLEKAKYQNHFGEKKSFASDLPMLVNAKEKVQCVEVKHIHCICTSVPLIWHYPPSERLDSTDVCCSERPTGNCYHAGGHWCSRVFKDKQGKY